MSLTNGKAVIHQNAPVGPRGAKKKQPIQNGGWNVVSLLLKSLKNKPYYVMDDGFKITVKW
jgi:hypothetical protein